MRKYRRWTDEELSRLESYADQIPRPPVSELASVFQRTESAIKNKLYMLFPSSRTNEAYTDNEISYIRDNIHRYSVKQLSNHLGRSRASVASVIRRLKLRRYDPDEWCKISDRITALRREGVNWREVARIISVEFKREYRHTHLCQRYYYNTRGKKWQQVKNTQQPKSHSYAETRAS